MVKNKWLLALTLVFVISMTQAVAPVQAMVGEKKNTNCISPKVVQLKGEMEKV